jgi:hypothetical protein
MNFKKNDTLAIKGIAIILMFIHHNFLDPSRFANYIVDFSPFTADSSMLVAKFFKICVGMFVFLSTYGMTLSVKHQSQDYDLNRKQTISATINRYISLIAGFEFVFILSQLFAAFYNQRQIEIYGTGKKSIVYLLIDSLGLAHLFETPTLNATWWYISLAIIIILIMPLLIHLYRKYGILIVFLSVLIPRALELEMSDLTRWLFAMTLGIYCADKDILYKLKNYTLFQSKHLNKIIKCMIATIILIGFVFIRQSTLGSKYVDIFDGIIPAFIIYYCYEFIIDIKYLREILQFLGKHSMNMFLTHTFIRAYYFKDFTYSFKYAWLITLVLLITSSILSVAIEYLKKLLHYKMLVNKFKNYITNLTTQN